MEHVDDITAIAIHPNKKIIATGEIGPYPLLAVWDCETMQCISRFTSPLTKGINHLTFSKDGKYIVASAADDNHCIAVFDWGNGGHELANTDKFKKARAGVGAAGVIATGKGPRANILSMCFNNSGDSVAATGVKVSCLNKLFNFKIKNLFF